MVDPPVLAAGDFGAWLTAIGPVLDGEGEADVPCGTCTGCCTSSQFVLIEADEAAVRAHVPAELMFPAPGRTGDHILGYDGEGRCPMLGAAGCTIYAHRPRTCRQYDCRVLAAADVQPDLDDPTKAAIAERVRRWRFSHPAPDDEARHDAVRAAARDLAASGVTPPLAVAIGAVRVALAPR